MEFCLHFLNPQLREYAKGVFQLQSQDLNQLKEGYLEYAQLLIDEFLFSKLCTTLADI
jgi:hypothetical protein